MPNYADISVPVARPMLPSARAIVPYLMRIDSSRTYSNFGPLVLELEARLAKDFSIGSGSLVTVSNATVGITLALQAVIGNAENLDGYCIIPSWTFVATAHAVVAAGLTPFLVDVDEDTWQITPEAVESVWKSLDRKLVAVVPVAPFGSPVAVEIWDKFTDKTGIPVVIDSAAAHDSLTIGETPTVVSLHATKTLTAGEGGYVASRNTELIREIKKRSNFGFYGSRSAQVCGANGKMSEYHAAVALASHDVYGEIRGQWQRVSVGYRELLTHSDISFQKGFGVDWISSVCIARFHGRKQKAIAALLSATGIDTREWWGAGVHDHPAFRTAFRTELPVTGMLSNETLGLPLFVDLPHPILERICKTVLQALN